MSSIINELYYGNIEPTGADNRNHAQAEKEAQRACEERGRADSYAPRKGKRAVCKLCECSQ